MNTEIDKKHNKIKNLMINKELGKKLDLFIIKISALFGLYIYIINYIFKELGFGKIQFFLTLFFVYIVYCISLDACYNLLFKKNK